MGSGCIVTCQGSRISSSPKLNSSDPCGKGLMVLRPVFKLGCPSPKTLFSWLFSRYLVPFPLLIDCPQYYVLHVTLCFACSMLSKNMDSFILVVIQIYNPVKTKGDFYQGKQCKMFWTYSTNSLSICQWCKGCMSLSSFLFQRLDKGEGACD